MTGRELPVVSDVGARRQARLIDVRIAVVLDTRSGTGDLQELADACCGASADMLVLRDKHATESALRDASAVLRQVADDHGALFVLNDLPGLAADVGADATQVGQTDVHPDHARRVGGPDLLVGRTVQTAGHLAAACDEDIDFVVVGPIYAGQPDESGRHPDPVGLDPVRHAAQHAPTPWFAGGGVQLDHLEELVEAGVRRVLVGGSVTDAADPAQAVWAVRRALARGHD